jgi:hypothetical protein
MKLAEALAVRSDASKRFEQLRSRAQAPVMGRASGGFGPRLPLCASG